MDAAELAQHYEDLRRGTLGLPTDSHVRVGLTILLRRGMTAWIDAVAASVGPRAEPRSSSTLPPSRHLAGPAAELARLVAGMAISTCRQECRP